MHELSFLRENGNVINTHRSFRDTYSSNIRWNSMFLYGIPSLCPEPNNSEPKAGLGDGYYGLPGFLSRLRSLSPMGAMPAGLEGI